MESSMELATLLGVETARIVRTTGEGREKLFSLIDVAGLVSGKDANEVAQDVRILISDLKAVRDETPNCSELLSIDYFQFPGERQRRTPVGDLRMALYVAIMQRSRNARKLAFKTIDVLVRYLGGNLELAQEALAGFKAVELPDGTVQIFPHSTTTNILRDEFDTSELCELLQVRQLIKVRTVGEGRHKRFSLVDVAMLVSGKESRHAAEDVKMVEGSYSEVAGGIGHFQFSGQGQRETPVADLRTTLLVVLRLRSRVAQKLTARVVDVFVRYIGGDLELAKETLANHEFQKHLAEEDPDNPARVFADAIFVSPSREAPQILSVAGMDYPGDHAYLFHTGLPGILKIGRAADVSTRREQVQRDLKKIGGGSLVRTLVVWKYCGPVEKHLHRLMSPHRVENLGKLTEYYKCEVQNVLDIFPEALACYQEENSLNFGSDDPATKRRRLQAELEETALRNEAKRAEELKDADARRAEELKEQQHKQDAELSKLEFMLKKSRLEKELSEFSTPIIPRSSSIVTEEMVKLFAQTCMTIAKSIDEASRIADVHRALAKANGFSRTPHGSMSAFEAAGFVPQKKCYISEGKPYKLV